MFADGSFGYGNEYRWEFRRGFVHSVTCTAADWLTRGDAIRAAHPVTRVVLTTGIPLIAGEQCAANLDGTLQIARWPGIAFTLPDRITLGDGTPTMGDPIEDTEESDAMEEAYRNGADLD